MRRKQKPAEPTESLAILIRRSEQTIASLARELGRSRQSLGRSIERGTVTLELAGRILDLLGEPWGALDHATVDSPR